MKAPGLAPRSLSVIMPAFNEAGRVETGVRQVHGFLDAHGYDAELILVDDGSVDATLRIVRSLSEKLPRLRVLTYGVNRGKGYAVRTGVLACKKDAVLITDVDLSTPMSQIARLWPYYDSGYPLVIGSRRATGEHRRVRQPVFRSVLGRTFNLMIGFLGVRGFRDTQCGFKLMARPQAVRLFDVLRTPGFAFDVEILLRARRSGLRIAEVPVEWTHEGRSKVRPVRDGIRMLGEVLRMQRHR